MTKQTKLTDTAAHVTERGTALCWLIRQTDMRRSMRLLAAADIVTAFQDEDWFNRACVVGTLGVYGEMCLDRALDDLEAAGAIRFVGFRYTGYGRDSKYQVVTDPTSWRHRDPEVMVARRRRNSDRGQQSAVVQEQIQPFACNTAFATPTDGSGSPIVTCAGEELAALRLAAIATRTEVRKLSQVDLVLVAKAFGGSYTHAVRFLQAIERSASAVHISEADARSVQALLEDLRQRVTPAHRRDLRGAWAPVLRALANASCHAVGSREAAR